MKSIITGEKMRKTKTIKIDDREITVRELRVKDIRNILEKMDSFKGIDDIYSLLPNAIDISVEDIEQYAPSELNIIYQAFREVNAVFLDVLKKSGIAETLKSSISKSLTEAFAESSAQATG